MAAKSKPNEIYIERLYKAPVKAVWDAWTDPEQAAKWWGPRGFTITTHSKDFKVGGIWHYTMHGPDGTDYPNKTVYLEIEKGAKMVYDHGGNDDRPPLFRVTVTFKETKGQTLMCMTMALATPEQAAETRKFIKAAGGNSTWDRLSEYLDETLNSRKKFEINRTFATSVANMHEMWVNPKHFAKWLAPTGMTMESLKSDVREGGQLFYSMSGHGMTMYGRVLYKKIDRAQLQYVQEFTDKDGAPSRHPGMPDFPGSMLTTVTMVEEEPGVTRVTVEWEPASGSSAAEIATFIKERAGMTQGWTGSFDKLDDHLRNI